MVLHEVLNIRREFESCMSHNASYSEFVSIYEMTDYVVVNTIVAINLIKANFSCLFFLLTCTWVARIESLDPKFVTIIIGILYNIQTGAMLVNPCFFACKYLIIREYLDV